MTIVRLRAPVTPLYLCGAARRGGATAIHGKHPRSGCGLNWISNSGDLFKRKEITFLTFSPLISTSHLNSTIPLFTN
jgi:hypothetical protein